MERLLFAILISGVWLLMAIMDRIMPQISAVILILFFMIVYAGLLTATQIHQKRKNRKYPQPRDENYLPKVSVIVPAHNESMVIERTVERLMRLNYPDYELLIVDDRSTDDTPEILKRLQARYADGDGPAFRVAFRRGGVIPGKSAVLNDGLALTDGELICVFDADASVPLDFLKNIVPYLADEGVGAVQARKVISNERHNGLTRFQHYEYSLDAHFQCGRDSIRGAVELRGNGQVIKREALIDVNGWNNRTVTDDLDLSTRLHLAGWDIRFAQRVVVAEEGIIQFMPLLRQRRRWAEGSLMRYLEYAGQLLTSEHVSLRTTADMVAYFVEYLYPVWVASDYVVLGMDYLMGRVHGTHILTSLFLMPLLSVFFSSALIVAILRFNRPKPWEAAFWAIATGLYMTWIWVPVVFWIMMKFLVTRQRELHWGKTEHFGVLGK